MGSVAPDSTWLPAVIIDPAVLLGGYTGWLRSKGSSVLTNKPLTSDEVGAGRPEVHLRRMPVLGSVETDGPADIALHIAQVGHG
jgi:hypothetical protein